MRLYIAPNSSVYSVATGEFGFVHRAKREIMRFDEGLKHSDEFHQQRWLAELSRAQQVGRDEGIHQGYPLGIVTRRGAVHIGSDVFSLQRVLEPKWRRTVADINSSLQLYEGCVDQILAAPRWKKKLVEFYFP